MIKKNKNKKKDNKNKKKDNKVFKLVGNNLIIWILIIIGAFTIIDMLPDNNSNKIDYKEYKQYLNDGKIESIVVNAANQATIKLRSVDGLASKRYIVGLRSELIESEEESWNKNNVDSYQFEVEKSPGMLEYLFNLAPWILIIVFWFYMMRRMQGGGGQSGIFSFVKSKARLISPDDPKVTFDEVAGCDEAKVELQEIVQFLKNPKKYLKLGATIPKGALLVGSPGTGKTLLARAVAGESKVPFFCISGAEFVEMFVGVGAGRVRDLFAQAKKNSPSIIFVDEIDAVGRHRGAGLGGGHDEREQTLNQILVEMDGFNTDDHVVLLAATNRPDVLDKALLRPGRFDRQIVVDAPTLEGREAILKIHTKKIPLDKDVDLLILAKGTPGLVGADLENLANEAALLAARRSRNKVMMIDFEDAKDKVMMGVERKSMILTDEDKKITAYHEAGHTIVAYFTKHTDPVHKVSIIPRGMALGITAQIPDHDKHNYSKKYLLAKLDVLMGGRCAEKLIFSDISTGAGNDIEVATNIAKKMVCEWGMSENIGPITFGKDQEEMFLGREISRPKSHGEEISKTIDSEIMRFIFNAESNADKLLKNKENDLHRLAEHLLKFETISSSQLKKILNGENLSIDKSNNGIEKTPQAQRKRRSSN